MSTSYVVKTVRTSAILTGTYVAGTVITNDVDAYPHGNIRNQMVLEISFTKGSLTTAEVKVEFSEDATTYYQETFQNISSATAGETLGEHQLSATGNYIIAVPFKSKYIKISAKGTGTATSSLMAIQAVVGVA